MTDKTEIQEALDAVGHIIEIMEEEGAHPQFYEGECKTIRAALEAQAEPSAVDVEEVAEALNRAAIGMPYDFRTHTPMVFYRGLASHLHAQGHLHPTPVVPEGYALVPIKPNQDMIDAGARHRLRAQRFCLTDNYKAMIAAAPQPPKGLNNV